MTEFATWRSLVDGVLISGIPDRLVSRDPDVNQTSEETGKFGLRIVDIQDDWSEIDIEISENTSGVSRAEFVDFDSGDTIDSVEFDPVSDGDIVTIEIGFDADQEVVILLDNKGESYQMGFDDDPDHPYESDDGNLQILSGANEGDFDVDTRSYAISRLGNL